LNKKQMLVPESFMVDVCRLVHHLWEQEGTENLQPVLQRIQSVIDAKCSAREKRRMFSEYKTAQAGSAEREQARQAYLDNVGVHKDWRSDGESPGR